MEIMKEPVVTSDGHTYERGAIEQWLHLRNTSPKTGAHLPDRRLIPNHALRSRIQDWLQGYQGEMGGGGIFDF